MPNNPGTCFWGRKKPLREARGLTPWFWARTGLEPGLSRENRLFTLKIKYLGKGSNLPLHARYRGHSVQANHGQRERIKQGCSPPGKSPSSVLAVPAVLAGVRTRRLRGASSVCQTTGQSGDGGPFGQGIPRSKPSFPRSEPSFRTQKPHFLTSFQQRKIKFSDA